MFARVGKRQSVISRKNSAFHNLRFFFSFKLYDGSLLYIFASNGVFTIVTLSAFSVNQSAEKCN